MHDAERAGAAQPDAMTLATASRRGVPSLRWVLLKGADRRGFVFFTDTRSRKGRELARNPHAALAFYWQPLGRQVRVEGRVAAVPAAEADAYWASRPRGSQLSAAASRQGAELPARRALVARRRALERTLRGAPVPRPPAWSGYRLVPEVIEFWIHRGDRLHQREIFLRSRSGWRRKLLQP